jgi:3-hydroxyacyl-CoA dehydrogenase
MARRAHRRSRRRPSAAPCPILAGGALPHRTTVSEDYLLDLEREAFVRLCGERKTLERIQHTLKTGKTLRN